MVSTVGITYNTQVFVNNLSASHRFEIILSYTFGTVVNHRSKKYLESDFICFPFSERTENRRTLYSPYIIVLLVL